LHDCSFDRCQIVILRLLLFCLSSSNVVTSFSAPTPLTAERLKVVCESNIGYTNAHRFIETHYSDHPLVALYQKGGRSNYFGKSRLTVKEPIYDARQGFWDDHHQRMVPASLDECGFTLVENSPPPVQDWSDKEEICQKYLPQLRGMFQHKLFPDKSIRHLIFWHMNRRGKDLKVQKPNQKVQTSKFVGSAHIDTDVGCYNRLEDFVRLFENNCVEADFPRQDLLDLLQQGRRCAIINVWRNIAKDPIQRAPLAIMPAQYNNEKKQAFPNALINVEQSRWYVYPEMQNDELLVFSQFDRNVQQPSDLWHTGLVDVGVENVDNDRESFDIRCLVVFDEIVPPVYDRLGPFHRREPMVSERTGSAFLKSVMYSTLYLIYAWLVVRELQMIYQ
jgi:hypothetical protein